MQAHLPGRLRGALLWPGSGAPLVLLICLLNFSPMLTVWLVAGLTTAGVITGFLLHRAGKVRTAKV